MSIKISPPEHFRKAIEDCTEALWLDPEFFEALLTRGDLYLKTENNEKALQDFFSASQLKPENDGSPPLLKL